MRFITGFLFAAVLAFSPVSLRAEALLPAADEVQTCKETVADHQRICGSIVSLYVQSAGEMPDTDIRDEDPITILAESGETEAKKSSDATPSDKEYVPDEFDTGSPEIYDPLAPVNRVMFHFNDKLYFWVFKPVAQGYSFIVPELVRIGFSNAYDNLRSPIRIVNNMLQLRFKRSGGELVRFVFNSVVGVGGFVDVSKSLLDIEKHEADFGQTLGRYGVGHGIYLVLPVIGPSSARDGIGFAGDASLSPLTYISFAYLNFWEAAALFTHEKVNDTSFRIGDYEAFKQAAIDPYISMRDAFVQYRQRKVDESKQ